jgi:predicted HicB family RNase H-like nuclease
MKNLLKYKSFLGTVSFNLQDRIFYGKIEGISEVITYQGRTLSELIEAFHRAAKKYCENCNFANMQEYKRV